MREMCGKKGTIWRCKTSGHDAEMSRRSWTWSCCSVNLPYHGTTASSLQDVPSLRPGVSAAARRWQQTDYRNKCNGALKKLLYSCKESTGIYICATAPSRAAIARYMHHTRQQFECRWPFTNLSALCVSYWIKTYLDCGAFQQVETAAWPCGWDASRRRRSSQHPCSGIRNTG
jgi:hypothetical protein